MIINIFDACSLQVGSIRFYTTRMSGNEQAEQPVQKPHGVPLKKTYKEHLMENPLVALGQLPVNLPVTS